MSEIGFSEEEKRQIALVAKQKASSYAGYYASVIAPSLAFAVYGIVQRDFVAISIAFASLLIFVCWHLSAQFSHYGTYQSIFQKILKHEETAEDAKTLGTITKQEPPQR